MGLNRYQIGTILETIFNLSYEKKFYTITPSQTLLLVTIIKELIEENERLRSEVSVKKKLLDEAERRYEVVLASDIDQIAKEMLDGEK